MSARDGATPRSGITKTKFPKESARQGNGGNSEKLKSHEPDLSAEATVVANYLDWLLFRPRGKNRHPKIKARH